jgi:hypothetical protein
MLLAFVCLALVLMMCNMYRLDDAVLDLVADDGAGIKKQKSVYHWDKVMLSSCG